MSYFTIQVNAQSEEELNKRIADNELRGFEVVKFFQTEKEHIRNSPNVRYRSTDGTHKRYRVGYVNRKYGAVMRRENRERSL